MLPLSHGILLKFAGVLADLGFRILFYSFGFLILNYARLFLAELIDIGLSGQLRYVAELVFLFKARNGEELKTCRVMLIPKTPNPASLGQMPTSRYGNSSNS